MLRKTLMLAACFCFLSAPLAMAAGNQLAPSAGQNPGYAQTHEMCYTGLNGSGEVIGWAKDKMQCELQSTGQSWGNSAGAENFTKNK